MTNCLFRPLLLACLTSLAAPAASASWRPASPVEIVVPGGAGGGADQLARFIAKEMEKQFQLKTLVSNKKGGSGSEGYLHIKGKKGDDRTLIITLSNIFTLPLAIGAPYKWSELTPIARMALDDFILWVPAQSPYRTLEDYLKAVKAAPPGAFKMAGTGAVQEDQLITGMLEQAASVKFTYVPMGGGGEVARALVDGKVDSTVNNPAEMVEYWKASKVRPLAVFNIKRLSLENWGKVPTMREKGYDLHYQMMRGIFGPPGMPESAAAFYANMLKKISSSEEFKAYLKDNALEGSWLSGVEFIKWLQAQDKLHADMLGQVGLK